MEVGKGSESHPREANVVKSRWLVAHAKLMLIAVTVLFTTFYAGDYVWFQIRMSHPAAGQAFGAVRFYWATSLKNGKEEIFFDQPQTEKCVQSLFPHLNCRPCWYSRGKTIREIE